VGDVNVGTLSQSGSPVLKRLVLDSRLIRGVATADAVAAGKAQTALLQAENVTLRNTSKLAADAASTGNTNLVVMARPPVADATAEGVTIGPGSQRLAFNKAELATTGDVVLRGTRTLDTAATAKAGVNVWLPTDKLSAQGDLLINAARVTAATKAQSIINSDKTLTIAAIGEAKADPAAQVASARTLGNVVGAGANVTLTGERVVQAGIVDLPSGQITITGRGQEGSRDTVVFSDGSQTKVAGWVAKAGDTWAAVASAGAIKAQALAGDIVLNGTLDVSAPVSTTKGLDSGVAGSVSLLANKAAYEVTALDGGSNTTMLAGAVVLGDKAKILGSASKDSESGVITVDAGRLVLAAAYDRCQIRAQQLDQAGQ
jgi:hypothetical protein